MDEDVTIYALIRLGPVGPRKVIVWFESRAAARQYARDNGIVHFAIAPMEFDAGRPRPVEPQETIT
ncbi:hypothetical protein ND748_17355 [Frankia sp. AiPs1]|uniref:hypothetical protein n=1 Tax=Frankia sp. AiPs1 TaxID=573493 RepID=UPI0020444B5C|nr:hypothetical protein [Frankia sp. AiPs1]MCM3923421.1 hypothetical protein [Frankia sp. AiPs1]